MKYYFLSSPWRSSVFTTCNDYCCRISSIRHCVLVCNSPPYHMPAEESKDYSGYNSEQLASMMGKVGLR
jgi:hypothetical protein